MGVAAEAMVDNKQFIRSRRDSRPVDLDDVVVWRAKRFTVVIYVLLMAQIAWENGLEMRVPKEERGFIG